MIDWYQILSFDDDDNDDDYFNRKRLQRRHYRRILVSLQSQSHTCPDRCLQEAVRNDNDEDLNSKFQR